MRAVANLPTGKSISFFVESSVLSTKNNSQKHASDKLFAGNNTRRMSNIGTCFKTARVHFNNWNTWGSEEFLRIFYRFINFNIRCKAFLRPISQYQRIYIEFFCPFKACYSFALSTFFFLYSSRYIFVEPSAVFHDARYKKTRVCCLLHFSLTAIGRGIRHEYHSGGEHNLSVRVEYVPFVRELYLIRYPTLMTLPDRMRW